MAERAREIPRYELEPGRDIEREPRRFEQEPERPPLRMQGVYEGPQPGFGPRLEQHIDVLGEWGAEVEPPQTVLRSLIPLDEPVSEVVVDFTVSRDRWKAYLGSGVAEVEGRELAALCERMRARTLGDYDFSH